MQLFGLVRLDDSLPCLYLSHQASQVISFPEPAPTQVSGPPFASQLLRPPLRQSAAPGRYRWHHCAHV